MGSASVQVAANICIVGLSLYGAGFNGVGNCMQLGLPLIVAIIFFSQYLRKYYVPLGSYKWRVFELFPIILAIAVVWIYGIIMTEAGMLFICKTYMKDSNTCNI